MKEHSHKNVLVTGDQKRDDRYFGDQEKRNPPNLQCHHNGIFQIILSCLIFLKEIISSSE